MTDIGSITGETSLSDRDLSTDRPGGFAGIDTGGSRDLGFGVEGPLSGAVFSFSGEDDVLHETIVDIVKDIINPPPPLPTKKERVRIVSPGRIPHEEFVGFSALAIGKVARKHGIPEYADVVDPDDLARVSREYPEALPDLARAIAQEAGSRLPDLLGAFRDYHPPPRVGTEDEIANQLRYEGINVGVSLLEEANRIQGSDPDVGGRGDIAGGGFEFAQFSQQAQRDLNQIVGRAERQVFEVLSRAAGYPEGARNTIIARGMRTIRQNLENETRRVANMESLRNDRAAVRSIARDGSNLKGLSLGEVRKLLKAADATGKKGAQIGLAVERLERREDKLVAQRKAARRPSIATTIQRSAKKIEQIKKQAEPADPKTLPRSVQQALRDVGLAPSRPKPKAKPKAAPTAKAKAKAKAAPRQKAQKQAAQKVAQKRNQQKKVQQQAAQKKKAKQLAQQRRQEQQRQAQRQAAQKRVKQQAAQKVARKRAAAQKKTSPKKAAQKKQTQQRAAQRKAQQKTVQKAAQKKAQQKTKRQQQPKKKKAKPKKKR